MITKFFQPTGHVVICLVLADVVDEKCTDGTSIICRGNGSIALLACRVPNLSFDGLRVNLDGSRGKLDTDGRLGIEVELISGESTQKVGFADTRVTDKHDCMEGLAGSKE